ncbi:hypothetical protein GJ496_003767 [Pomphorhynchus laevis]|nr:hypothetical protein GJ496_003767 [Pomphorhynchus laevis]
MIACNSKVFKMAPSLTDLAGASAPPISLNQKKLNKLESAFPQYPNLPDRSDSPGYMSDHSINHKQYPLSDDDSKSAFQLLLKNQNNEMSQFNESIKDPSLDNPPECRLKIRGYNGELIDVNAYTCKKTIIILSFISYVIFLNLVQLGKIISVTRARNAFPRARMSEVTMAFLTVSLFLCLLVIIGLLYIVRIDIRDRSHQLRLNSVLQIIIYLICTLIVCNAAIAVFSYFTLDL